MLCRGQIEGSIHMGLGYALTEDLPGEDGMPVTASPCELGVLRARDMPKTEVVFVEEPEPEGPFGAKGVGETGLLPPRRRRPARSRLSTVSGGRPSR